MTDETNPRHRQGYQPGREAGRRAAGRTGPAAFDELYGAYAGRVLAYARRRTDGVVDDQLLVDAALARLPESEREALELTVWDGLDGRQAAQVAGCTAVTMRVRLHRARRRLTAVLTELNDSANTADPALQVVGNKEGAA